MSRSSLGLSARSYLIAGMSAAVVGAAVVTPASVPTVSPAKIEAALNLTSVTTPLEVAIKNTYDRLEPWAAYAVDWADYVLGFIPVVDWVAPIIPLVYNTVEPLVQAGVYSVADLIGLDFASLGPDIWTGVTTSVNNAIEYALAWANIPLPPPWPGAAVAAGSANALPAAAADLLAAPRASSITSGIEVAIKNTYNWAEGWTNYAMQWADYVMGLIPVVNFFTPAIPLVYNTIEPLVRGGVYTFADVIGLNFAAIGPDIRVAIRTSIDNAINGVLNWINIPLPPPRPGLSAATTALRAASLPAAEAVTPEVATEKVSDAVAEAPEAATPGTEKDAPEAPAEVSAPESTPAAEAPAKTDVPAAVEAPAAAEPVQSNRLAHLGRSVAAAATDSGNVKAERSARAPRADRG